MTLKKGVRKVTTVKHLQKEDYDSQKIIWKKSERRLQVPNLDVQGV
jgi:hypothetical protein